MVKTVMRHLKCVRNSYVRVSVIYAESNTAGCFLPLVEVWYRCLIIALSVILTQELHVVTVLLYTQVSVML